MYKIILFVTLLALYVESKPETLLDELIERVVEKKLMNDNLDDKCTDAGIPCFSKLECNDCGQAGRCIKGNTPVKCMCWWGWTGPNARRAFGNHILADSCLKACHYTHDHWNPDCLKTILNPKCDEDDCDAMHGICINDECVCDDTKCGNVGGMCHNGKCKKCDNCDHGKCIKGVCHIKCCRDITPFDSPFNGGHFKNHCENRCKWVEEMPGACTQTPMEHCNPKCALSGGQCDTNTGRCKCCKDFTGPGAMLIGDDIYADYCDLFCSSNKKLCVNDDYVKRLAAKNKITK